MNNQIVFLTLPDGDGPPLKVDFTKVRFYGRLDELLEIIELLHTEFTLMMTHRALKDPKYNEQDALDLVRDINTAQAVYAFHIGSPPPRLYVLEDSNTFYAEYEILTDRLAFPLWVNQVNNILYANGCDKPIDESNVDFELDHLMGFHPQEVAAQIMEKPLPPKAPEPRWSLWNWLKWGWLD